MQENPEYSVFSLQTVGFYCIFVGLFQKLGILAKTNPKSWEIVGKMSANSIEFSKNSGNLGQNVQYFTQMATLFVAFPEYSGNSNQFVTFSWGFFQKLGKFLSKYIHLTLQITKLLALAKINVYKCIQNATIFFSLQFKIT